MDYKVELIDSSHYVMGLAAEVWNGKIDPNTMLLHRYDTRMRDADMMLGALYDMYQCDDKLKEGDTFTTEFGRYVCKGVHVLPLI